MPDPTTNYGWDLPDVSGDAGSWGTLLNTILNDIDDKLYTADTVADAALPVAGGVMTGHLDVLTSHLTGTTLTGGSGTKTLDLDTGNYFRFTTGLSGTVTLDITNIANYSAGSTDVVGVIAHLKNAGAPSSITYKVDGSTKSIKWQDGVAPTFVSSGDDILVLYTYDGGTNWIGVHAVSDPS